MTEAAKRESLADIAADIRKRADVAESHGDEHLTSGHAFGLLLRSIADRIDAAADLQEADALFTGAFCEATRKAGNAAKTRKALGAVRDWLEHISKGVLDTLATSHFIPSARPVNDAGKELIEACKYHIGQIDEALSDSARNCDIYSTASMAKDAFNREGCPGDCGDCVYGDETVEGNCDHCDVNWVFDTATTEKGGTP